MNSMKMHKLHNLAELRRLLEKYTFNGTLTNNFLFEETYDRLILNCRISYIDLKANLFIIEEKDGFYRLYYHINDQNELLDRTFDSPVMMEILYRGEDKRPDNIFKYWETNGFHLHLIRDNYAGILKNLSLPLVKNQ